MDVALLTVGDELLAGETENTNASWLARELTDRGCRVTEVVTVGDDREHIAGRVRELSARDDRLIVTGGLGGTPDDRTMAGVAAGLDRGLTIEESVRERAREASDRFVEAHPELAERYDLGLDADRVAETVTASEPIPNPEGLAPGCVVENVYVLPGVPSELKASFESVAADFDGPVRRATRYTDAPEGVLGRHLANLESTFDVQAGSYPGERTDRNRVRVAATEESTLEAALDWLSERIDLQAPKNENEP